MRKIIAVFFAAVLLLSVAIPTFPASADDKAVSYRFDADTKTLYIEGNGAISDTYLGISDEQLKQYNSAFSDACREGCYYDSLEEQYRAFYPAFYADYTRLAEHLVIGEGITSIGNAAFMNAFPKTKTVKLPSTLRTIGRYAFQGFQLKTLVLPSGVTSVSGSAFYHSYFTFDEIEGEWYYDNTDVIVSGKSTKINAYVPIYMNDGTGKYIEVDKEKKLYGHYTVLKGSKAEQNLKSVKYKKYKTVTTPGKVSNIKLTAKSKGIKVSWKKKNITGGYQIQYATNSKFTSGKKTVTVSSAKTASKTIKKLKSKKKYYVRIRAYKTYKGAKFYGAWSKAKSVTTDR